MTRKENPWSRKNPTTRPSGDGSSKTPRPTPKSGSGKLAGLKKPTASLPPQKDSAATQRKGALARLTPSTRSSASTSPAPSTKVTSPATSNAGTRSRRPTAPVSPSSTPTSVASSTEPSSSTTSQRILSTQQPFGGATLHEGAL